MAPLPMALGRLARQANLLLVEIGNYAIARRAMSVATYNFAASLFCLHNLYLVAVVDVVDAQTQTSPNWSVGCWCQKLAVPNV